jgi:uncharacterized protein with gpF-like domain
MVSWLRDHAARIGWDRWDTAGPYPSTDSFIQAHLAAVGNYLVRIPDEVYQTIFAEISEGTNHGESVEQVAARIEHVLDVTGSENWPARARLISITEVNGAANAGWYAAGQQLQQVLGQPLFKKWLASHDERVRPTHREADGQVVPFVAPFIVGGWPLLYPGDKNGPPEEVINCRCAAATEGA